MCNIVLCSTPLHRAIEAYLKLSVPQCDKWGVGAERDSRSAAVRIITSSYKFFLTNLATQHHPFILMKLFVWWERGQSCRNNIQFLRLIHPLGPFDSVFMLEHSEEGSRTVSEPFQIWCVSCKSWEISRHRFWSFIKSCSFSGDDARARKFLFMSKCFHRFRGTGSVCISSTALSVTGLNPDVAFQFHDVA